ncbi:MAG: LysR family transcriptional regulator [Desulfitobacteriaceae bacterium]|nr:LysR family transcriptional regulator [Desulfitobacteriaceae bacterium]
MNSETLKTFIILARCKNFTRTAQELSVVQSTVSSRIKTLETELGQKLLDREKQNIALTKIGEEFLDYAIKMLEMEEYFKAKIKFSAHYKDKLNIYCAHSLFDCYISEYAIKYIDQFPNISLKLSLMHSEEILPILEEGKIDITYMNFPFHNERYFCIPFVKERVALVTNSSNKQFLNDGISKEELLKQPMIFSDITDNNFEHLLPKENMYPLDINIHTKIIPFLKSGNWYSFLPFGIVEDELKSGNLIEIPLKGFYLFEKQSYIIYKRNFEDWKPLENWLKLFVFDEVKPEL